MNRLLHAIDSLVGCEVARSSLQHARAQIVRSHLNVLLAHAEAGDDLCAHASQHERAVVTLTVDFDLSRLAMATFLIFSFELRRFSLLLVDMILHLGRLELGAHEAFANTHLLDLILETRNLLLQFVALVEH